MISTSGVVYTTGQTYGETFVKGGEEVVQMNVQGEVNIGTAFHRAFCRLLVFAPVIILLPYMLLSVYDYAVKTAH